MNIQMILVHYHKYECILTKNKNEFFDMTLVTNNIINKKKRKKIKNIESNTIHFM